MKRWVDLNRIDLPALNGQLKNANLPEISLESKAQANETQSDLE
jgi:hypothetical protein